MLARHRGLLREKSDSSGEGPRAVYVVSDRPMTPEEWAKAYANRRVLRLTLLAPDIIEAILSGRQPAEMTLAVLMRRFPVRWTEQRKGRPASYDY